MGKSPRVPVLCPYRVSGLGTRVLGPCWLLVWGRKGSCRADGEQSPAGSVHPFQGSWRGQRYLGWSPMAGGT